MVAGYHLIWTVYGYWLANDPRGSTSREVRVELLQGLGDIHYGRKRVQPSSAQLRQFKQQAEALLHFRVLTFAFEDIAFLAKIFGQEIASRNYTCYACAIMPDHVHMLIRRHRDHAEEMIEYFQEASRAALFEAGKRELPHPIWSDGPGWKGFLNTRQDFGREIEYIRQNPIKIGWPEQRWEFVTPYKGWMPGYRG